VTRRGLSRFGSCSQVGHRRWKSSRRNYSASRCSRENTIR